MTEAIARFMMVGLGCGFGWALGGEPHGAMVGLLCAHRDSRRRRGVGFRHRRVATSSAAGLLGVARCWFLWLGAAGGGITTAAFFDRWEQVDLVHGRLHVHRLKNGMPSVHPLTGIELRALRRLQREQKPGRYPS
jgi:hypothetical protein